MNDSWFAAHGFEIAVTRSAWPATDVRRPCPSLGVEGHDRRLSLYRMNGTSQACPRPERAPAVASSVT
jgi:hypothetical protein